MKIRFILSVLCVLLFSSVFGQEKAYREGWAEKPFTAGEPVLVPPGVPDRAVAGEKEKISILSCYVLDQNNSQPSFNWIQLSAVTGINIQVYFTALATTTVRFHFLVTGPEFHYFTTSFGPVNYGKATWAWVTTPKSTWLKKGLYKLVVIAEPKTEASGAGCAAEAMFRIF